MRNVVLGVSGILVTAALVPGRADAQVGFGILGGTTVPASSLADVAATGWNAGGFVSFGEDREPAGATLRLKIDLPREGPIIVNAEMVYRDTKGVAVRFVDLDRDSASRLTRTIDSMRELGM